MGAFAVERFLLPTRDSRSEVLQGPSPALKLISLATVVDYTQTKGKNGAKAFGIQKDIPALRGD
jgi:hypothetical protein